MTVPTPPPDGRPPLKLDFHCAGCGYGLVRMWPPGRCPMCGNSRWRRRPRTHTHAGRRLEAEA